MLFAIAGAAVETCLANAYSIAQFFGWAWGRHKKPWETPRFTMTWILLFLIALAIVLTGVDVMTLVEFAVLFSILVLPLTYFPLLLLSGDRNYMRPTRQRPARQDARLAVISRSSPLAAIAALPLYFLTSGGNG